MLTLPPFPLAKLSEPKIPIEIWLPENLRQAGDEKNWELLQTLLRDSIQNKKATDIQAKKLLSYVEVLVRLDRYEEPYKLVQQIINTYQDSDISDYAKFLFLYIQAKHEEPISAFLKLKALEKKLGPRNKLAPYMNILLAEIAMKSSLFEEAEQILKRDEVAYTGTTKHIRFMRQTDIRYLKKKDVEALVSYMELSRKSDIIKTRPMSLAYYSTLLYTHSYFKNAAESFETLSQLIPGQKNADLALYMLTMSKLRINWNTNVHPALSQIQDGFPGTDGGFRAFMKLTDIQYLSTSMKAEQAAQNYHQIAQDAPSKMIREEATFKEALVYGQNNDNLLCIDILMRLLREFKENTLQTEAQALLIEKLPQAIRNFVNQNKYVDALVLAKKNRSIFTQGWLDNSILYDMANGYSKIGAFEQASKVYQYILESAQEEQREKVYLPLITSLYENSNFRLINEYAERYEQLYPSGADGDDIFLFRLKALTSTDKTEKAAQLIDNFGKTTHKDINIETARVYFELKRFEDVIFLLSPLVLHEKAADSSTTMILAESLFQTKRNDEALALFQDLQKDDLYHDQALYREGLLFLELNKEEEALNRFKQLAEKGKDPLWIKLAKEEIQILQLPTFN